jgi:hypothetical protein
VSEPTACPRCGHAQRFAGGECERCGVIFARLRARAEPAPAAGVAIPISRDGWIAWGAGAALALLTQLLPLLQVLVGHFVVLVHELGHALAGWIFGFPSLPAFDFVQGGGMTAHLARSRWLVVAVYGLLAAALWILRRNRASAALVAGAAALYTALLATGLDEAVIVAFGHGGELVFAAVFLHRALSGGAVAHSAERPLYAWLGFHVLLHDARFAWGLATSGAERAAYAAAKGGGHGMDFSRLERELLGVPIEALALAFLAATLATPGAVLLAHARGPRLAALGRRLLQLA